MALSLEQLRSMQSMLQSIKIKNGLGPKPKPKPKSQPQKTHKPNNKRNAFHHQSKSHRIAHSNTNNFPSSKGRPFKRQRTNDNTHSFHTSTHNKFKSNPRDRNHNNQQNHNNHNNHFYHQKHSNQHSQQHHEHKPSAHALAEQAVTSEADWTKFFNTQYDANNERRSDWKPPETNTWWEQGPIGLVNNWWNDNEENAFVDPSKKTDHINDRKNAVALTKYQRSKKLQQREIKKAIKKELKQQRLEKRLRARIAKGEIVEKNSTENPFESFFDSAMKLGDEVRDERKQNYIEMKERQKKEEEEKQKTKIYKAGNQRKLKEIASFQSDELFYFDSTDNEETEKREGGKKSEDILEQIPKNDMIYVNENSVVKQMDVCDPSNVSALESEQILLRQRVQLKHKELQQMNGENEMNSNGKKSENRISTNLLSDTFEDSLKEKKLLKRLNVMDYVINYKDPFFREVEELNLNLNALVENWKRIKQTPGLSRKLVRKLGILMARKRKEIRKEQQKAELLEANKFLMESTETDETETESESDSTSEEEMGETESDTSEESDNMHIDNDLTDLSNFLEE